MITKKHHRPGGSPTAAELNTPYDELVSASVTDVNTASGWMTLDHIATGKQCNRLFDYTNDTQVTTNYNNISYATISQGGADAELPFTSFEPLSSEMTRFCASGLVTTSTVAKEYDDSLLAGKGRPNYYAFRLLLTYRDSGSALDQTINLGEWGYSFTPRSRTTQRASGTSAGNIQYQTFQFSKCLRYDGVSGFREYKKVELQVKVYDNANTVGISRHQLFAISAQS